MRNSFFKVLALVLSVQLFATSSHAFELWGFFSDAKEKHEVKHDDKKDQDQLKLDMDTAPKRLAQIKKAYFQLAKLNKKMAVQTATNPEVTSLSSPKENQEVANLSEASSQEDEFSHETPESLKFKRTHYIQTLANTIGSLDDAKTPLFPGISHEIAKIWKKLDHSEYRDVLAFLVRRFNQHPDERDMIITQFAYLQTLAIDDPKIQRGYFTADAIGDYANSFLATMAVIGTVRFGMWATPRAYRLTKQGVVDLYRLIASKVRPGSVTSGAGTVGTSAPTVSNFSFKDLPKNLRDALQAKIQQVKDFAALTREEQRAAIKANLKANRLTVTNKLKKTSLQKASLYALAGPLVAVSVRYYEQSIPDRNEPEELMSYLVNNLLLSIEKKSILLVAAIEKDRPTALETYQTAYEKLVQDFTEAQALIVTTMKIPEGRSFGSNKNILKDPKWKRSQDPNDDLTKAIEEGDERKKISVELPKTDQNQQELMSSWVATEAALERLREVLERDKKIVAKAN